MRHHDLITIRRYKVLEYLSTGHLSHREIANKLNVSADTVDTAAAAAASGGHHGGDAAASN